MSPNWGETIDKGADTVNRTNIGKLVIVVMLGLACVIVWYSIPKNGWGKVDAMSLDISAHRQESKDFNNKILSLLEAALAESQKQSLIEYQNCIRNSESADMSMLNCWHALQGRYPQQPKGVKQED